MNRLFFILISFLFTHPCVAQLNYNFLWVKSPSGSSNDQQITDAVWADSQGNSYQIGSFTSANISFSPIITLTNASAGNGDVFLAKYDKDGVCVWAKSIRGFGTDYGRSITTDNNNNVFISGRFDSQDLTFAGTAPQITNINATTSDTFIAKYDANGNFLWARSGKGNALDGGNDVVCDAQGNVTLVGSYNEGGIYFGTSFLANQGAMDCFLVKYDPNGNVLWANSYGSAAEDAGRSVAIDSFGNLYLASYFQSSAINFGNITLYNFGGYSGYVAKFSPAGMVIWAVQLNSTSSIVNRSVACDAQGNLYVTGDYTGTASLGNNITLPAAQNSDTYIAKYNSNGIAQWAKRISSSGGDYGFGIAINPQGGAWVTGYYNGPTLNLTNPAFNLNKSGNFDSYLIGYDDNGTVIDAVNIGGGNNERGYSVQTNTQGTVFTGGQSGSSSVSFPPLTLNGTGFSNAYIAKYDKARPCIADFVSNSYTLCTNDCISLTDQSTNATSWLWSLPGSNQPTTTQPSPTNVCYPTPGKYPINLTTTNDINTSTRTDTITVLNTINARITTPDSLIFCEGSTIQLTAQPSNMRYNWNTGETSQTININKTGTYTVTINSILGGSCTGFTSIQARTTSIPTPTIRQICYELIADTIPNITNYQWLFNGEPVQNATSQNYTVKNYFGRYAIQITNELGCVGISDPINVQELQGKDLITINPTPTKDILELKYTAPTPKKATITLINTLGQIIWVKKFDNDQNFVIDLQPYATGVYFVKVNISQCAETVFKTILQKR